MRESRRGVYADEDVDVRVVRALRAHGFDVVTAGEAGLLRRDDDEHLAYAAASGRVLLTFNRRDFRRSHAEALNLGRLHAGIVLLPTSSSLVRTIVRARMLLDWLATFGPDSSALVNWNDLQVRLHHGERLAGYSDAEVRIALGLPSR
jgi:hypothetical protein